MLHKVETVRSQQKLLLIWAIKVKLLVMKLDAIIA